MADEEVPQEVAPPPPEPEEDEEPTAGGEWTSGRLAYNSTTRKLLLLDDGTKVLHRIDVPESEEYDVLVDLDPVISPLVASMRVDNVYSNPGRAIYRAWSVPSGLTVRVEASARRLRGDEEELKVRGQLVYQLSPRVTCYDEVVWNDDSYPCAAYRLHLRGLAEEDLPAHVAGLLDVGSRELLKEEIVTLRGQLAAAGVPATTDDSCRVNLDSCQEQLSGMAIKLARAEGRVHELESTAPAVVDETPPPARRDRLVVLPRRSPPAPQPEHVEPPVPVPEVASVPAEPPSEPAPTTVATATTPAPKAKWDTLLECVEAKLDDPSIDCDE